jgi:hypothetical protein
LKFKRDSADRETTKARALLPSLSGLREDDPESLSRPRQIL